MPGANIPENILNRLKDAENPLEEGIQIAAEQAQDFFNIANGIHLMAVKTEHLIPDILEKAGIILDDQKSKLTNKIESKVKSKPLMKESVKSSESDLKRLSEKALNNKLKIALEKEDYELAASLRDELNRRNPHK